MWRAVYSLILRLHPRTFRDEYAEEMQWIFDQEALERSPLPLVLDCLASLIRQRWRRPESMAFGPVAEGAPSFQQLDMRVFGGSPLTGGFVAALALLVLGFSLIVQHGYYPGLLNIPTIYQYGDLPQRDLELEWAVIESFDMDGDGWISSEEQLQHHARRWAPLFEKAKQNDGRASLDELKALLSVGPYWY